MSHHSHCHGMRSSALLVAAAAAGCTHPLAVAERAASDDVRAPLCTFDISAPEAFVGTLTHPEAGLDCVPPEYGDTFTVGFAHDGWRLVARVPRAANHVGDTIALDGRRASMLYQSPRGACSNWVGEVIWIAELPAWSLFVDATCSDGSARVVGQWSRD